MSDTTTDIVAALRDQGVDYLTPTDAASGQSMDARTLLSRLATHPHARLRQALIALFLLHPHFARVVPALRHDLEPAAMHELMAYYMAAVYLQRMWRIRLGHYLPAAEVLPDWFGSELHLPDPDEGHGRVGLSALADWHQNCSPHRFNHLSEYQGVADLVFQSLKMKKKS